MHIQPRTRSCKIIHDWKSSSLHTDISYYNDANGATYEAKAKY